MARTKGQPPEIIDVIAGNILKKVRNVRGVTQETLADNTGITFQQVQKYEKGKNRMSVSRLFGICKVLEVDPSAFMFAVDAVISQKLESKREQRADSVVGIITAPTASFAVELGE